MKQHVLIATLTLLTIAHAKTLQTADSKADLKIMRQSLEKEKKQKRTLEKTLKDAEKQNDSNKSMELKSQISELTSKIKNLRQKIKSSQAKVQASNVTTYDHNKELEAYPPRRKMKDKERDFSHFEYTDGATF